MEEGESMRGAVYQWILDGGEISEKGGLLYCGIRLTDEKPTFCRPNVRRLYDKL